MQSGNMGNERGMTDMQGSIAVMWHFNHLATESFPSVSLSYVKHFELPWLVVDERCYTNTLSYVIHCSFHKMGLSP